MKSLLLTLLSLLAIDLAYGQFIRTIAGIGKQGYSGDGGPALKAAMNNNYGIAIDPTGVIYIADVYNNAIRKIDANGIISTIAGNGTAGYSGDGGPASSALLNGPITLALDDQGNIYFSDQSDLTVNRAATIVRKISAAGIISTFAGNVLNSPPFGSQVVDLPYFGNGGPATDAGFSGVAAIACDKSGNVYIGDTYSGVIRKVNSLGIISTMAGSTPGFSGDGGPAALSQMNIPSGMVVDAQNNLYFADAGNNRIRKINLSTGVINTIAGTGIAAYTGDGGPATLATINDPQGLVFDKNGNLYESEYNNNVVRKIDPSGIITSFAGNGTIGYSGDCGPAIKAQFREAGALACDNAGNLYVSDSWDDVVRMVGGPPPILDTVQDQAMHRYTCVNDNTDFGITSNVTGMIQWQVNTGSGWTDLPDNGSYSGSMTGDLAIQDVTASMNKYLYRCIISSNCNSTLYTTDTLSVAEPATTATLDISASDTDVCTGSPVTFTSTLTNTGNIYHYQWLLNGADTGADTTSYGSSTLQTGDQVQCTVTITSVCASNFSVASNILHMTVNQLVQAGLSITTNHTEICQGDPVRFSAIPVNGGVKPSYQWSVNSDATGTDNSEFVTTGLNNGDNVSCLLTSSLPCASPTASANTITMIVNSLPAIDFSPDTILSKGKPVQLLPHLTGVIALYQWTPATGLNDPSIAGPMANPRYTTTYQLVVTTDKDCTATGQITVALDYPLLMPSAFTPNGDGHNDVFRIPPGVVGFSLQDFSVFNRWGEIVFTTKNIGEGWDGTYKGSALPGGTYVYLIKGINKGKPITLDGTVILVR